MEVIAVQKENIRRKQGRYRKQYRHYIGLAMEAKIMLLTLASELKDLELWECRHNAKKEEKRVVDQ